MERSTRIDEQLWRAEACAAVQGDERWTCLTATIAGGGSERLAVYRMQLTGARRTVALADGAASGVAERRASDFGAFRHAETAAHPPARFRAFPCSRLIARGPTGDDRDEQRNRGEHGAEKPHLDARTVRRTDAEVKPPAARARGGEDQRGHDGNPPHGAWHHFRFQTPRR
jgi:hypothetical protein